MRHYGARPFRHLHTSIAMSYSSSQWRSTRAMWSDRRVLVSRWAATLCTEWFVSAVVQQLQTTFAVIQSSGNKSMCQQLGCIWCQWLQCHTADATDSSQIDKDYRSNMTWKCQLTIWHPCLVADKAQWTVECGRIVRNNIWISVKLTFPAAAVNQAISTTSLTGPHSGIHLTETICKLPDRIFYTVVQTLSIISKDVQWNCVPSNNVKNISGKEKKRARGPR